MWAGRVHDDGRLSSDMDVAQADRLIRATTRPYPGAFIDVGSSRLRVWAAEQARGRGTGIAVLEFRGGVLSVTDGAWESLPTGVAAAPDPS